MKNESDDISKDVKTSNIAENDESSCDTKKKHKSKKHKKHSSIKSSSKVCKNESTKDILSHDKKARKEKRIHSSLDEKSKKKTAQKHKKKKQETVLQCSQSVFANEVKKELSPKKSMAPMTKEEFDKKQSVVRRVYDSATGRHRLIKGDGEVIEEIVSYSCHKQINQVSTQMDGKSFAASIGL